MGALKIWLHMPWRKKVLLFQIVFWLFVSKVMVKTMAYKRVERFLGRKLDHQQNEPGDQPPAPEPLAADLGYWVERLSDRLPWNLNCLPQAMTARFILKGKGYGGVIFIGVTKDDKQQLESHAWFQTGPWILTGAEGAERFSVIAAYG